MTDKQMREFAAGKTLDELMNLLISYGMLYVERPDDSMIIDRAVGFIKAEIENRVCGL